MTETGHKPGWLRSLIFGNKEPSREHQAVVDSNEAVEQATQRLDHVSDKFGTEVSKMQRPRKKRKKAPAS